MPIFEISGFITFVVLVTLIVLSPGPNLFLLINDTPIHGRLAGLSMTFGFCIAILTHAALALIGVGTILLASKVTYTIVKSTGALYLIYLGINAIISASSAPNVGIQNSNYSRESTCSFQSLKRGFITNIFNPKPAVFYLAVFPQFLQSTGVSLFFSGMSLASIHAVIALMFYGSVVFAIDYANKILSKPVVWKVVRYMSGVILIILGARMLLVSS